MFLQGLLVRMQWLYASTESDGYKYRNWENILNFVSHPIDLKNSLLLTKITCWNDQDRLEFLMCQCAKLSNQGCTTSQDKPDRISWKENHWAIPVRHILKIKVLTQIFRSVWEIQMIKYICRIIPRQVQSSVSYPISSLQ